jgi:DNA recombination protein RmuC
MEWVLLAVGLVLGAVIGWLVARLRYGEQLASERAERSAQDDRNQWADHAEERLREAFASLASQTLSSNSQQYLTNAQRELKTLVEPLTEKLDTMGQHVRALESKREGAYGQLGEQLRALGQAQTDLQRSTVSLEQALKSPTARGKWGELQLRRIVELAGMQDHVDFDVQFSVGAVRPDMVIHMPRGGDLPVDAKAPANAYLEAVQLEGGLREARLDEHAKALKERIRELAKREYRDAFPQTPELVVMFVPFESALSAAFEADKDLLSFAFDRGVLVASPVTLLALLRTVAYGWQQLRIAENAKDIQALGQDLYKRLSTFVAHLQKAGERIAGAVQNFDAAVGSWERMLLPAVRRLRDFVSPHESMPTLDAVEEEPRLPGALADEAPPNDEREFAERGSEA